MQKRSMWSKQVFCIFSGLKIYVCIYIYKNIYMYSIQSDLNSSFFYSRELQKLLHVCKVLGNMLPQLKHAFGMAYFYLTHIFWVRNCVQNIAN